VSKLRGFDAFCGAGGCTRGYQLAGFEMWGCDVKPQPRYAGERFFRADALELLADLEFMAQFDFVHASPPCQHYTSLRSLHKQRDYPDLIAPTRELLEATGLPYVIENVELARKRMRDPILVCGSMFDPPMDVKRHRYFEANWPLEPPMWPCRHKLWDYRYRSLDQRKKRSSRVVQVHGGNQHGREYLLARVVGVHGHTNYAGEAELRNAAMGIDWMSQDELTEAIPPKYTAHVGAQLALRLAEAAA
jgi:DNA (cytosine-5)-methyltransferase 1